MSTLHRMLLCFCNQQSTRPAEDRLRPGFTSFLGTSEAGVPGLVRDGTDIIATDCQYFVQVGFASEDRRPFCSV